MAETNVPGTGFEVEVPPKGVRLRSKEKEEIKEGDVVYLFSKGIGEITAINQPYKIERKGDDLVLKPISDDLGPAEARATLAKEIANIISPKIKEQVASMVEEALKTKHKVLLEKMKEEAEAGKEPKMKRTRGCVFLEIGDLQTVL